MLIGVYDYTVVLTYLSLMSAGIGIIVALSGNGHPYVGVWFLMFCGLFDAFDGKVARTKENRSEMEKNFGIQIDSLSDMVAFGVLPACIGAALMRNSTFLARLATREGIGNAASFLRYFLFTVLILYMLSALIRLAYFNVTEEERQKTEDGAREYYTGLPVTSSALIFPAVLVANYLLPIDATPLYFIAVALTSYAFLCKAQVKKPKLKGIMIMLAVGAVEFIALIMLYGVGR